MNLTPEEREEILINYSKSCIARIMANEPAVWLRNNYEQGVRNGRDSTIKAIRDGLDTWERIAAVAEEYEKSL